MGIFQRLRAAVARSPTAAQVKMVTETGNGLYVYDGNLYKSDIVRACIRPKIKHMDICLCPCQRLYAQDRENPR